LDEVIKKIQAVTVEDVHQVVKDLVKASSMRLAVIGPYKDRAKFIDLIKDF